jgi:TatD DNase family protein
MLVDTHCHLGDPGFDADRREVLARAGAAGVGHVVIVADSEEGTSRAIALARELGQSATAGVHPHLASQWRNGAADRLRDALADPVVVAVGEIGLDYHYDYSPRETQRSTFETQLRIAADCRKPVVVHARSADDDMAAVVRALGRAVPALVLHSFSSGPRVFEAGMDIGAYFSFSGMITFKNWKLADCVTACPADRLLVETDAPYLAPVPLRGRRNEPAYVVHVAARLAQLRGVDPETIATLSTANAQRCFGERVGYPTTGRP